MSTDRTFIDRDNSLFAALFDRDEAPPKDHQKAVLAAIERRSKPPKRPNRDSLAEAIARRRPLQDPGIGAEESSMSRQQLEEMMGVEALGTEPLYDSDDCTVLDLPDFAGLGGRRVPDYPLSHTVGSLAIASSPSLQVDVSAACSNDVEAASAYLGFWIYPRHDVPFHKVVITAHMVGESHGIKTGDESTNEGRITLEVGTVTVPVGLVRPGYSRTALEEYFLPLPRKDAAARVPERLTVSFRARPFVFHYVFIGAHARAATEWSRGCFIDPNGPHGPGGPGFGEPREDISTAGAAVNLAVCAVDVAYEPLVLPEELERRRHEELRDEIRQGFANLGGG